MPYTTGNGARIHWQESGSGSPLLLIMGHCYSSQLWYPLIDTLARKHRVIYFDNRGTGRSDTTRRVTVAQLAQDALAVMDAAGVDSAHVHGVSMGGVLALELAMQQPRRVRSLMLGCAGILSAEKPRKSLLLRLLYRLPRPLLLRLLTSRRGDGGYGSAATAERVAIDREVLRRDVWTRAGIAAQAMAMAAYRTNAAAVSQLTMPALVLHGDEDRTVPARYGVELAEALPAGRYVNLPGAGHNYIVAAGADVIAPLMLAFLDQCDRGAAPR